MAVPVSWPELFGRKPVDFHARGVAACVEELAYAEDPEELTDVLALAEIHGAALAIVGGRERARAALAPFEQAYVAVLDYCGDHPAGVRVVPVLTALDFQCLTGCSGVELGGLQASGWLAAFACEARIRDGFEIRLASLDLALSDGTQVPTLCGQPDPFTPGLSFGHDIPGLLRYLAAARAVGAPFEAVAPAWRSCLVGFPHKLAANTLRWPEVLAIGCAVYVHHGGLPPGEVADRLHQDATEAP